jgi:Transglutaminase-like domain
MAIREVDTINVSKIFFVKYKIFIVILIALFIFQVNVVKALPKQIDVSNAEISIDGKNLNGQFIFTSQDKNNPLRLFRYQIPKELICLTDEILSKSNDNSPFGVVKTLSLYSANYKYADLKVLNDEDYITEVLTQKVGMCRDFANLLSAMLAVRSIKSRMLVLHNYPNVYSGHVVIEVLVNDKWVVFDPSYSSYFSIAKTDGTEELLSFDELRSGKYEQKDIKHTILNKERYDYYGKYRKSIC